MVCHGWRYAIVADARISRYIRKMCLSVKRTVKTTRGGSHTTPTYNIHPFKPYHSNATTTRFLRVWKSRSRRINGPSGRARSVNRGRMTSTFKYIIYRKPESTRVYYCRLPAISMTTYITTAGYIII